MSTARKASGREAIADDNDRTQENSFSSPATPQNLSIDDIMWRVRAEVARRRNGLPRKEVTPTFPNQVPSFEESIPSWKPSAARLPAKDKYTLSELLVFSDADFIDVAYRAVLRRPPDEEGFNHYLRLLRAGANSKLEILGILRFSEEGTAAAVQIDGLDRPYALQKWRRKRFIGPIVAWIHALLRLGTAADRQVQLEARQALEIHEVGRSLNEASSYLLQRLIAMKVQLAGRTGAAEFEALKAEQVATAARLNKLQSMLERELTVRPDAAAFAALRDSYAAFAMQLAELSGLVQAKSEAHEQSRRDLEIRLEAAAAAIQQLLAHEHQASEAARALDSCYAAFEDRFRGDRSVIRARVEPYLRQVREAGAGTSDTPVIDVGCGRGEWLEVLRDDGLIAKGLEINRVFIEMCRGRGFEVIEGDAIESLQAMPNGSAGAITSIHLIEHLPFERVITLLDEARRVLRPGGLIILETPNPENLAVGHRWFYMDPTHRNPLPPEALRWFVEARGFLGARIERLVTARELSGTPLLPEDAPGATSINVILGALSAAPDYAIVAKRP
jgi:O-antigen chain-terminating methyltransferase